MDRIAAFAVARKNHIRTGRQVLDRQVRGAQPSSRTWNYATAGAPAARTGSAARRTPATEPPLKGFAPNQLWCEIVALACELLAWTQLIALAGAARRWEPKCLRLRIFSIADGLASSGRRLRLRLAERWPWAAQVAAAVACLQALPSG